MSINPKISAIINDFQNSSYFIKALDHNDIPEVKNLLKAHNHPVSEHNLGLIIRDMQTESPDTFYLVVYDKISKQLIGFSNLWYERKYTRGLCILLHIGQIFVSLTVPPTQAAEVEYFLVDSLTQLGMKIKDCYKSTMHIHSDRSSRYKQINYEKSEVHMALYHYAKPKQSL
ncbi:hypothetical protein ABPG72_011493 [Tetrahymena utriculariae]